MYEMKTAAETIRLPHSDREKGLDRREVLERRTRHGANRSWEQTGKSVWQMILGLTQRPVDPDFDRGNGDFLLLGEAGDAIIIVTVVVLNAAIGVIQEGKAGKAVEALKKISSPQAVVVREGKTMKIGAEELVTGDIVLLEAGKDGSG